MSNGAASQNELPAVMTLRSHCLLFVKVIIQRVHFEQHAKNYLRRIDYPYDCFFIVLVRISSFKYFECERVPP